MQEARYKAFISYSHTDDKWARWLHRSLESYKPPKHLVGQKTRYGEIPDRLAPIFRDREELPSATDLGGVISEALAQSACQVVICSPAAARSKWVNEEILAYKRLGREDRIFCLIIAGEPNATDLKGRADEECFPQALRFKLAADGTLGVERTEPIAADARDAKDGKANAKIKLIAGMLGVGFDVLRQRELHRRHRRMMAIAAASIAGMVVTSGLAVAALLARAEAIEQRARAQAEAETSRQVTNFLVDSFEISDPSQALGNTITAREILDRGARRIEFELADQPAIQATLMDTMGTVYKSLGLYDEARGLIDRGLSTRRALFGDRNIEVARSEANIGHLLGLEAELDDAAASYEEAIATFRATPDADPRELALGLFGLADVRSMQGDDVSAEGLLREAIEIQRAAYGEESPDLARSFDQLGVALKNQARYDEAEPLLREALAMFRRLVPSGLNADLDDSLNDLAVFLYEAGEYGEAEQLFRESLEINRRLLGDDHRDVAGALNNLAFVLQDNGELDEAEQYYTQALEIRLDKFGDGHPATAQSLNNLAFLYHDQGRTELALEFSRRALETYRRAYPGDHAEVAYGLQNLAGWLVEEGNYAEAEPLLQEALAINQRVFPSDHPEVAITQSGMAVLLLATDRAADALDLAKTAGDTLSAALGPDHWRTAWAHALEGASLTKAERFAEAEPLLLEAHSTLTQDSRARGAQIDSTARYLFDLYTAWGRPEEAGRYREFRTVSE
jgi:tetratricopeptide (TPR) repeat protein